MKKALFFFYSLFLGTVAYISYFFVDENLLYLRWFYTHFMISRVEKALILFIILILFFVFYTIFLLLYRKKELTQKDGVALIVITIVCLLFAYPAVYSYDIFNYIATAKVAYLYGENPYIIMPIDLTGDPLLAFMHASNKTALYGPGWILLTFFPFLLGNGNFLLTLFLFKILVAVFYCTLLYCIYKLSKNFFVVLFFGLNPLIVIETLWSGHNDSVMMACLLAGFYLYFHQRRAAGIVLYAYSVVIKYSTGILLPLFFILKIAYRRKTITLRVVLRWSMYGMIGIFFLSSLREEIYPWYAVWFLPFIAVVGKRSEKLIAILFTFCLELRYFPYLLLGTHFGITPFLKIIFTFGPVGLVLLFLFTRQIWEKISLRYSR